MKRVIIEVDVGTDDYLALLLLLYAEQIGEVKIEAICCLMGNASLENTSRNLIRLLELINRTDIPVYKGAKSQLILPKDKIPGFHGEDGFGDLHLPEEPDTSIIKPEPSAIAIYNIINANPNEIYMICVGPLTNFAMALKLHDDLATKVKELWIMGGNYTGVGNVTDHAEYNFYVDPEAAYIVLETLQVPIYVFPWEACLLPNIPLEWRFETLPNTSAALQLLTLAEKVVYTPDIEYWMPCDAFAVFSFLDPEKHVVRKSVHHATVELCGSDRGMVILDDGGEKDNVVVIEEVDVELFKDYLLTNVAKVQ